MRLLEAKELVEIDPERALCIINDVLNQDPDSVESRAALFMAGYIMMQAGKTGLAYHIYQRCAHLNPDRSEIYSNMGMCLEVCDPEKAIDLFTKAFKLDNSNASAVANKALMYLYTGRPEQCVSLCDHALRLDRNLRSAVHNRGLAKIMLRDWSGWDDYYDTLGVKDREIKDYGVPNWEGQEGKVLVYGEQGVGDEVMFASCLEDLSKTNKVVFDCDKRLESIFKRSLPDVSVYGQRFEDSLVIEPGDEFDYQIAIGQLPKFYRRKDSDYPGTPYLKADPERVAMWDAILGDGPRVGISMYGGGPGTKEHQRSTTLGTFEPLFGENLICLDYKKVDNKELESKGIKYWERGVRQWCDLEDTLAIVANMDVIVTVCTTLVYFAGALGIPCHVLVPEHPGYRYHIRGDSFPWYDCVKLHRGKFKDSVRGIYEDMHRIRPSRNSSVSRACEQYNAERIRAC